MTSKKPSHQVLVEKVLTELANLRDLPSAVGTVLIEHVPSPAVIRSLKEKKVAFEIVEAAQSLRMNYPDLFGGCTDLDIFTLRHLLRKAWESSNPREREWLVFVIRNFHAQVTRLGQAFLEDGGKKRLREFHTTRETQGDWLRLERFKNESNLAKLLYNCDDADLAKQAKEATPPTMTPFEKAFFHLQRNLYRARVCRNPECSAPYFFRQKKGEEFCSPDCKAWGRRASKRNWWRDHRGKGRE
jgi:hypothetical protein